MYYAHFGLNEAPFRITPNTEVFFAGGNRGAILDALIYAIGQGEGIVKVTGEVGTGKTMLCNMLQSRLPPDIETVYLAHPSVSPEEILHAIAFELQLKVARDANRMEVMQALYSYLLERHAQNKQVVIFVEESQNMPIATLEEVRLLSNLETGKHKLLQIVLFGQPELDENLRQPHIRQLRERITHSFALPPLSAHEIGEYLMFRMRAVGYRGPDLFSAPVVKRIAQASAGLTRRINLIADKALLAAFSENTHTVQPKHVAAAIRDSEFARDAATVWDSRKRWLLVAATVLLACGAAFYWTMRQAAAPSPVSQSRSPAPNDAPADANRPGAAAMASSGDAHASVSTSPMSTPPGGSTANTTLIAAYPESANSPGSASEGPAARENPGNDDNASAGGATASVRNAVVATAQQSASQALAGVSPKGVPENPEITSNQPDMLLERIAATRAWLERAAPQTHSIQLLGSENARQLKDHLSSIAKSVEISKIYVYRTVAAQKPFLTVLYGSFGSREAAQNALDRLPPSLKAFKPYLRTVQGIREEMSRNKTL
jgi:type II secretory pathway predicted ATPase ExeA/septal ring-binding cell division protein DamX